MSDGRQPPSMKSVPGRRSSYRGGSPLGGRRRPELSEEEQAARLHLIEELDQAISAGRRQGYVLVAGELADAVNDYIAVQLARFRAYGKEE